MHHFQARNTNLNSKFIKECRCWFKIFQNVLQKNSIFLTSEAPLPPNLQNWSKSLSFHDQDFQDNLVLADWVENLLGWITLTYAPPTRLLSRDLRLSISRLFPGSMFLLGRFNNPWIRQQLDNWPRQTEFHIFHHFFLHFRLLG